MTKKINLKKYIFLPNNDIKLLIYPYYSNLLNFWDIFFIPLINDMSFINYFFIYLNYFIFEKFF